MTEPEPFAAPDQPVRTNQFGTPVPPGQQVPVDPFGAPNPYAPPPLQNPAFLAYGPPGGRGRPGWVAPVGAVAGVLVLLVTAYVVFGSLLSTSAPRPTSAPSIDLGHLGGPTSPGLALPAPLTAAPVAGSRTVVTPASARTIVASAWSLREVLLTTRNVSALSSLETGSALAGDQSRTSCGCLIDHQPAEAEQIQVLVTPQAHYPATFLAEVAFYADGTPSAEILGFTRSGASAGWRVAFDTYSTADDPITLDHPSVDSRGYTTDVAASVLARARTVPGRLAAYWNAAKSSGKVPADSTFAPGYWTSQFAASSAAHRNGTLQSNGLTGRLTYSARGSDPLIAADLGPVTLACGLVHRSAVYTGYHGNLPAQDAGQRNWGPSLEPGIYREIDVTGLSQSCFYLDNRSASTPVKVAGGDPGDESRSTGRR